MRNTRRSPEYGRSASAVLYWSTILFLTIMNFFVAFVLIPFFLVAPTLPIYFAVAIFGLLFGQIFSLLMEKIEFLERHHRLFASIFIPLIGIVALLAMLSSTDSIASALNIEVAQNPRITVVVYIAAFLLPNTLSRILSKKN